MIKDPQKQRILRHVHRVAGLVCVAFTLLLVATGIMLNHTGPLDLGQRRIGNRWVLRWYGLRAPPTLQGYAVGEHWLTQAGETLYFDARPVAQPHGPIVGAVVVDGAYAAATANVLFLFTADGQLIEELGVASGLPADIQGMAAADAQLLFKTPSTIIATTIALDSWTPTPAAQAAWATPSTLPAALTTELEPFLVGEGVSWERLIMDLHSGRIIGPVGVWMTDLIAVLLLVLAGSGLVMYSFRPKRPSG
ncbi:MAG: hypothetical protein A3K19_06580 [Lentisphaerae bacterium RIFOXYB12_FULL_65_16]|nr:MAG: hypothetical protein A3K18_02060 [Lentisphaerae bacterium RIFOXYA12_64_32]OGV93104.1 MAG: hypothetical protein A3K19_06580 [Lentisphaerae bacterium RIFOXYB12_FULL_65_16]